MPTNKTRSKKLEEYESKYSNIPKDYNQRLEYMINNMKLSESKMISILNKKSNMEQSLQYFDFKVVLYEDPEGAKRPRFRLINMRNYMNVAIHDPSFVHVYSPNAAEDHNYMHKLIDNELVSLSTFIQTPATIKINTFHKTPSYFNSTDIILAEIGLHRPTTKPDFDNIAKKYCDMFNANIWLDDAFVQDGEVHKYYSILPRVDIHIRYLNYVTNYHQYSQIVNRKDYNSDYPIDYLNLYGRPNGI